MSHSSLVLKKNEERRLLAGHLWIYSNEIDNKRTPIKQFSEGELVQVEGSSGRPLGLAYINPHTLLCGRILTSNSRETIDKEFFVKRIKNALNIRETCYTQPFYRLVFGESDWLPGLVIERLGDVFVIQISTAGMENFKLLVVDALIEIFQPKGILFKNDNASRTMENLPLYVETAMGTVPDTILLEEHKTKFIVPLLEGQKTGWFFDQCINRAHLLPHVKDKRVLDVFSYIGSWGIEAAVHGASHVTCIDSSHLALDFLQQNAELNHVSEKIDTIEANAFEALEKLVLQEEKFDIVILDPPALIKSRKDIKVGLGGYLKLHKLAMKLLQDKTSLLFSSSCSMHLEQSDLLNIIRLSGIDAKKKLRIIDFLHQAPDHPIHPAINETNYLKGVGLLT